VQALDAQLRKWFRSGAYNGAPGTDARYPQSTYWWLYGRPDR
jgi:hypothetical protein